MPKYLTLENVTVKEHKRNDFGDITGFTVEDIITTFSGSSFPKSYKISLWETKIEVPPIGAVVTVVGEPVYNVADEPSPKTGKRAVYETILKPRVTIHGNTPAVVSVETAANILATDEGVPF